jgi:diguanylate cyclase (GGDEF)-like protein
LLVDRVGQALERFRRNHHCGAVLFIDLDNFKSVNDARGHDKGDILLQQVGERLKHSVRSSDTVARFGGDEFVLLLEEAGAGGEAAAQHAREVADKILRAFETPFDIDGVLHYSSPSVGVTIIDRTSGSMEEVLKRADLAMYQSKAAGCNTSTWFEAGMEQRVAARAALEADLRQALNEG